MTFDWGKASAGNFKEDSQIASSANDITAKRKRLVQAIKDHISANLHDKPVMERKAKKDDEGNIVKGEDGKTVYHMVPKSRVTRMSNPTSKEGEVVCQLKYGNKAFIKLNDMDAVKIPQDLEEDMWEAVIAQIDSGDLDKEIERAAEEATPTITKK
jgi:hypothetical protein